MMRLLAALLTGLCALSPLPLAAQGTEGVVQAELRPGWRRADGEHVAALHLRLAPGWKTYWRAPGDAGIPPLFDWSGSQNTASVTIGWPTPKVFFQGGMRSVGYAPEVVLPLRVATLGAGDVRLTGEVQIGVCHDICMPQTLRLDAVLPAGQRRVDPVIAAAMAQVPFSAAEAGVRRVACTIGTEGGAMTLRAEIDMTDMGAVETVIETANPQVWVAEPKTVQRGGHVVAETRLMHESGKAFALDRSGVRITLLGEGHAVDIRGCDR